MLCKLLKVITFVHHCLKFKTMKFCLGVPEPSMNFPKIVFFFLTDCMDCYPVVSSDFYCISVIASHYSPTYHLFSPAVRHIFVALKWCFSQCLRHCEMKLSLTLKKFELSWNFKVPYPFRGTILASWYSGPNERWC